MMGGTKLEERGLKSVLFCKNGSEKWLLESSEYKTKKMITWNHEWGWNFVFLINGKSMRLKYRFVDM